MPKTTKRRKVKMKLKHIIVAVLLGISFAMIPNLHQYAEAHRVISGIGGEIFLPALVLAAAVMIDQFRTLWKACDENEVNE